MCECNATLTLRTLFKEAIRFIKDNVLNEAKGEGFNFLQQVQKSTRSGNNDIWVLEC